MKTTNLLLLAVATGLPLTAPALAQSKFGAPVSVGGGITLDPMLDLRLRYEGVDQPTTNADALTLRMRPGITIANSGGLSFLIEGEATLGIVNDYNDTNAGNGVEPFSVVADPEGIELNRLQVAYAAKGIGSVTIGRQRINLDDQRFVGSVGWRQNEQTFDAVTVAVAPKGVPISMDATYAISQRTIFGSDAGPREHFDGDFIFFGAASALGPVKVKGFAYLLDYDAGQPVSATSTSTYGLRATTKLPLGDKLSLDLMASYAKQEDYKLNPNSYSVDYLAGTAGLGVAGFTFTLGYENLGADGAGNRFQTPLATLHKFNGWADLFLNTPPAGLEDIYGGISTKFSPLGGITATVLYHDFSSDVGSINYGNELDAEVGFKFRQIAVGIKYANYNAKSFGADTEKVWLSLGYSL